MLMKRRAKVKEESCRNCATWRVSGIREVDSCAYGVAVARLLWAEGMQNGKSQMSVDPVSLEYRVYNVTLLRCKCLIL